MTSSIINFIAEKYLANIVEINPEQTKSSLWSGVFEMSNLKVKKEIFESLNLPYFELINGYVGRLRIELSLPRFYLSSIKVEVDKVFFYVRHKSLDKLNRKDEELSMEKYKNAKLLSAEQFTTEVNKMQNESSSFITNIINNVQITINDICIRFEDMISSQSSPFALGVLLNKLIIQTTTDKYEESANPEQIPFAEVNHKLVKVSNLSIFLDIHTGKEPIDFKKEIVHSSVTAIEQSELKAYLGGASDFYQYGLTETLIKYKDNQAHSYLLFDLVMNLRVALNENEANGKPKILAECLFNDIKMFLCLKQVKVLMQLLAFIKLSSLYELGIRKAYYVRSLTQEEKSSYMDCYIKYFTAKYARSDCGDDEVNRLRLKVEELQDRLTYETIQRLREACLIKIRHISSIRDIDNEIAELEKVSWNPLTYLMTSKTEKEAQIAELKQKRNALTRQSAQIEKECQQQMQTPLPKKDFSLNALKDNAVLYNIKLGFTVIGLKLFEEVITQPLLLIQQKRLEILINLRKGGQFYSLYIGDIIISQEKLRNTFYRNLFETIDSIDKYNDDTDSNATVPLYKKAPNNKNGALYLEFESSIHLPFSNYRLKFRNDKQLLVTLNQFAMTYSMNKIFDTLNTAISFEDIQKYTVGEVTKYVQEGYVEDLLSGNYQHFNIDLDVVFNGPIVLIPQNILDTANRKCLMVRLGDLNVKSKLPPKQNLKEIDYIHLNDPKLMYDVYIFEAYNFTLTTLGRFDGQIGHLSQAVAYDIIEDISVEITLSNIIEPKNVHLPKVDLQISINSIQINLRDVQFFFFIEFLEGFEKTSKYLQSQLEGSQSKPLNSIKDQADAVSNASNSIRASLKKDSGTKAIAKVEQDKEETLFLQMNFKLHSIKLIIQKTISMEERKQMEDEEQFKHFISFCIKQLDVNLSMTEKKNTSVLLSLFTVCVTDEETKYDESTKQVKLLSNPAFISLISTKHTSVIDILQEDKRGKRLLQSLRQSFRKHMKDDSKDPPFTSISYVYDSTADSSTVSVKMCNLKLILNLSTVLRLYQFLMYFSNEYSKMLSKHTEDSSSTNSLTKEYNQFEEVNQLKAKMLPKEGINQDFMSRLKNRAIKRESIVNEGRSIAMVNSCKNDNCTKEKGYLNTSLSLDLIGVELLLPVHPEEESSKVLKFNFDLFSKVILLNEYDSFFSNDTKLLVRVNYFEKRLVVSTKLYNIAFDILTYSNEKFRSNCLSEKILNNFRVIASYKAFLLLAEEKAVSTIHLRIEPMAMMIGFREVKVFQAALNEFEAFHKEMGQQYDDPIQTIEEDSPSLPFRNTSIGNGFKNLLRDKTKVIQLRALKTILQEETKQIAEEIDQAAMTNVTSFNALLDVEVDLERVTLRFMDNTQNYEASVFYIELNQLSIHYIINSEPNDVHNMANAIVEAIGGSEIPFSQFNHYKLSLYFEASGSFAISFFNDRVNNWEPIVEPWGLSVRTIQVAKFTRLRAEIKSEDMLNCNLSLYSAVVFNAFMKKMKQSEDEWFQESKNASFNTEKGDDSAVEFCNISGVPLTVWLDSLPSVKYALNDKEKKILTKNDIIKAYMTLMDAESQLIQKEKFTFKLQGYCEIANQDFSYSHFSNFIIEGDDKKSKQRRMPMTIRIKSRGMVKSILFESNISLFNSLKHPVRLVMVKESDYLGKYEGLDERIDHKQEVSEVLLPNKKYVIPLSYVHEEYRLYVGIVQQAQEGTLQFFMSDFDFLNEYHEEMAAYHNAPANAKPIVKDKVSKVLQLPFENRTHYVSVDLLVQKAKSDKVPSLNSQEGLKRGKPKEDDEEVKVSFFKTFSYFIVLQEPLVLENKLPFPVILSLKNIYEKALRKNIDLNPLDILPMHTLDPSESETEVTLSIHYNSEWYHSSNFFLFDKAIDKKRLIVLRRDDGQFIHISIDIAKNDIDINMYNSSRLDLIKVFSHRMKLLFYFEYLVINKTLCTLYGREDSSTESKALPGMNGTFYPLSISAFNITKERISLKEGNSEWCKPFELKTFGMAGICSLEPIKKGKYIQKLEIAVLISASDKFTHSTIITLEDRYLIMNELGIPIVYRQFVDKKTAFSPTTLDMSDRKMVAFIKTSKKMKRLLQVSFDSVHYSSPFLIEDLDDSNIKIPLDDSSEKLLQYNQDASKNIFSLNGKRYVLIKATVHSIDNGLIYIVLHYPLYCDYKIRNDLDSAVQIFQKNDDFNKEYFDMKGNEEVPYVWDDLQKEEKVLVCVIKGKALEVSFDKIEVRAVAIEGRKYFLEVGLENDNMTRVLCIKQVLASKEETTAMKILLGKKKAINCKVHVDLKGLGLSVIDDVPKEIVYLSISGLDVQYCKHINKLEKTIETTDNVIISFMNMQIDYCLWGNAFKSLLMPQRVIRQSQAHGVPFLQVTLSRRLIFNIEMEKFFTAYPQVNISMQDVNVFLDQKSLMSLLEIWKQLLTKIDFYLPKQQYARFSSLAPEGSELLLCALPPEKYDALLSTQAETAQSIIDKTHCANMLFVNHFVINALKVIVSLRIDLGEFGTDFGLPHWLFRIVVTIGNSLGHITNAPISFQKLISKNVFTDSGKILSLLMTTYQRQVFEQIYTIIGYSNLLGNPMGRMEKFNANKEARKSKNNLNEVKANEANQPIEQRNNVLSQIRANIIRQEEGLDDTGKENHIKQKLNSNEGDLLTNQSQREKDNQALTPFLAKAKASAEKNHKSVILPIKAQAPLGIRDQTKGYSKAAFTCIRFRFPRTIDTVKGLQPYNPQRAEIYAILKNCWEHDEGYKIVYFKDMIYFEPHYDNQISTLVLTDSNVLIVYNLKEIAFNVELRKMTRVEAYLSDSFYIFSFLMSNNKRKCFKTNDLILCCELYSILSRLLYHYLNELKKSL